MKSRSAEEGLYALLLQLAKASDINCIDMEHVHHAPSRVFFGTV
jgi:hypothetical protein